MTDESVKDTVGKKPRSGSRAGCIVPVMLFFLVVALLFVSGVAAALFQVFSEYSGSRNVWLLFCGVPVGLVLFVFVFAFTMYTRYGEPLQNLFKAIDALASGDLAARVPKDDSPQFGELIKRFNKMAGELERADQQRRNLTADIAHELRTPLHIIQGNLEGIQDGVYQATPEHIENTLEETRLLARLVEDLQTLSLAESGALPLHPSRFGVDELYADVVASFSAQAAGLGIDLTAAGAGLELTADYTRLNQVLANLVSNALRFTPRGGRITLAAEAGEAGGVILRVQDSGVGIAPEDLPFIFDRFWRGDKARTREGQVSSGLGLAIAQQLVRAHGGTIEAESVLGQGTVFVIRMGGSG